MALIVQAFILVATDDPTKANDEVHRALNGACFSSASDLLDFTAGVSQGFSLPDEYQDGSFVTSVPGAEYLTTANSLDRPI